MRNERCTQSGRVWSEYTIRQARVSARAQPIDNRPCCSCGRHTPCAARVTADACVGASPPHPDQLLLCCRKRSWQENGTPGCACSGEHLPRGMQTRHTAGAPQTGMPQQAHVSARPQPGAPMCSWPAFPDCRRGLATREYGEPLRTCGTPQGAGLIPRLRSVKRADVTCKCILRVA
jgi:hypothetical protein